MPLKDFAERFLIQPAAWALQHLKHFFLGMNPEDLAVLFILLSAAVVFGFAFGRRRVRRNRWRETFGRTSSGRISEQAVDDTIHHRPARRFSVWELPTFQNSGEMMVSHVLSLHFRPPDYHLMNHVTVRLDDGTTQIDHILVSRFGVFVIETKDFKGWIFANATDATWTKVHFRRKLTFQNPIFQNFRHVCAVQGLLDFLPPEAIKSVVVFSGNAEFKTPTPPGVIAIDDLVTYIRNQNDQVMSLNRLQFCVGRLETARLAISGKTDVEHKQSLAQRFGDGAV